MTGTEYTAPAGMPLGTVADQLKRTRRWVRFLAILTFIGAGFMLLAGAVVYFAGGAAASAAGQTAPPPYLGLIYLVVAPLYLIPGWMMWSYAAAITTFVRTNTVADLERAMNAQRRLWTLYGVLALIAIVFALLAMVGGLMFVAMRGRP